MVNAAISVDDFIVIGLIGSGSFGKVYKIVRKRDNKTLVWKEIHYGSMSDKEKQLLVSEVNIIKDLRHAFIVRYYDRIIERETKKIYIIMEYCPCGDLADFINNLKRERKMLDEEQIWRIFTQLTLALKECHVRKEGSPKVIHRDLKPANCMLDINHDIKLGDFGLARILSEQSKYAHTHVGTPYYMSPEQINERDYDEKSDVWSLGCVLYELCTLSPPFEAMNHLALAQKIMKGTYPPISSKYSKELSDLIAAMLTVDAKYRPTIEEICSGASMAPRIKETQLQLRYKFIKKREEDVKKKEKELEEKERLLEIREREIRKMEVLLRIGSSPGQGVQDKENIVPIYKNFKCA